MRTGLLRFGELAIALKRMKGKLTARIGIRGRLFLYLTVFVGFVIALLWLFQIVWLNDFYRFYKIRQVEDAAAVIELNSSNEDLASLVEQMAKQDELCIMILDSSYTVTASAEGRSFCLLHRMSPRDLIGICKNVPEDASARLEEFDFAVPTAEHYDEQRFRGNAPGRQVPSSKVVLLSRQITLQDGETGYLLINDVITPLDSTVDTLRSQLLTISLLVLLGALAMGSYLSSRFSRPLIETNQAAKELARSRYTRPKRADSYREIDELNRTLENAAQELSQVEHLQQELIANVSHDLRTPLTMIGGYAEVMRDIPGENTPENMQVIIDETTRLSSLVSELLDFSRIQAGTAEMKCSRFCLTENIRGIVSRCSALTEKDGYRIIFQPEKDEEVVADSTRIGQVLYNLINNALTYTGEDKTVTIRQIRKDDRVRIEVADTGKGIPAEEIPHVWTRYWRSSDNHKRAIQGSGLGLNIVRTILEAHKVPYGVESELGRGTCFWFELNT